uniref:NCK associated protein 5 n=1 Tax=Pelusios castaneus TaxID=367368 RepID=A0A8C8SP91_9SAUR
LHYSNISLISKRKLIHELEEERHLRLVSEKRLQEVTFESELSRAQMRGLQEQFLGIYFYVVNLIYSYIDMAVDEDSRSESSSTEKEKTKLLLERLKTLEAENSALALENENQREQYERCLDEVANQVVQALLTQKDLREECIKLKTRVFDLEQQNRKLSVLFQQRLKPASDLLLQSSTNWDKRISIGSSLPSNLSSPVDDLPPTRIKENHILEGLKKLQKRKILLEPPSVTSKWGYKDCMDSNEGIYSPGIKCGNHEEQQTHCKPMEIGSVYIEHNKIFTYDSDSHDDADDESSSLVLLHEVPSKSCRLYCNKLTHSISDSLFGWEPNGKHLTERGSYFNSKERPEKLTNFVNDFQSEVKPGTNVKLPVLQLDQSAVNIGWKDLHLQLSDTDDNEVMDELHIESSDEKSPSELLLTPFTNQHTKSSDMLAGTENSQFVSTDREEKHVSTQSDSGPKTCHFIKQQKVIKKTSSEECTTVIFDAEDGEPIEFSSHQTGVVTVRRNEISINPPQSGPNTEYTELTPQGINNLQTGADARNYTDLDRPADEIEKKNLQNNIRNENTVVPMTCRQSLHFERALLQNTLQQKLVKPAYNVSYKASSISTVHADINQKQNLTKIPSRGKFSPQKFKMPNSEESTVASSSDLTNLEKSPALSPMKLPRFEKAQSPTHNLDSKIDIQLPKHLAQLPQNSKIPGRSNRTKNPKSQVPGSPLSPHHLIEPSDYGEPPTRDIHCDLATIETQSQLPPPPPGRSTSLLIKPNYEHSPPLSIKPGATVLNETTKNILKSSPLKGNTNSFVFHNQSNREIQTKNMCVMAKIELAHLQEHAGMNTQNVPQQSHSSPGASQGPSNIFTKRACPKTLNQSVFCSNQELSNQGLQTAKPFSLACISLETTSSPSAYSGKKGLSNDHGVPQSQKMSNSLPTSPQCHTASTSEPLLSQVNRSSLPPSFHGSDTTNAVHNAHEKGLKTRLPVGLKLLIKSPQPLRKSSTVPGKQEKDTINAASKSNVSSCKYKQESMCLTTMEPMGTELRVTKANTEMQDNFSMGLGMDTASPHSPENCSMMVDREDGLENKLVKRSISSSNKTYLKPALGMNGAKARSQSFSIHIGEKPATPVAEGKVRTQIITNTSERGNSLTRQNSTIEGFQIKSIPALAMTSETFSNTSKVPENFYSRQGSDGSMNSSISQHGSPSKLPYRTSSKVDLLHSVSKCEGNKSPSQRDTPSISVQNEKRSENSKQHPLNKTSFMQTELELDKSQRSETSLKISEISKVNSALSSSVVQPTIEEKVMLCIQENVQKGQGQNKSPTTEMKQKTGPSIANWFGFRKSKLPALNSRKTDVPKTKVEKKEAKGSGFGNKQAKSEKKKDKKKTEQYCGSENEFNKKTDSGGDILDDVLKSKKNINASHDIPGQIRSYQKSGSSTITYSAKDSFMKELLNRVDKKAAQQTESGSNNVSYRSMSKGSSQGSSLPSNSISTQGNHKKSSRTKADMEMQNETLTKVVPESQQEDEEDTIRSTTCQNHVIESCCQMRTLDSGIGTFPLPDSGNRSTGRYVSKQESTLGTEVFMSPEQALPSAPSVKAKTLEREVPSTAESQESVESIISHSTSDPTMTAKVVRPFQSRLPKPVSPGMDPQGWWPNASRALRPPAPAALSSHPSSGWPSECSCNRRKLKQSLNTFNSNNVILLEEEKNCLNKVEGQKEENGKNEEASLNSSDRHGVDNLESLSESLYDSFSSCASQASNDV